MNFCICSQWISVGIEKSPFGRPLVDGWGKVYIARYLPSLNVEAAEALAATTPLSLNGCRTITLFLRVVVNGGRAEF